MRGYPGSETAGKKNKLDTIGIRPMKWDDLDQVMEIEKVSFTYPWQRSGFTLELAYNTLACYLVALQKGEDKKVLGYGGIWFMGERTHVTTLAVHPSWRGHKVGSAILYNLILRAYFRGSTRMSLEVRVSNFPAQNMYKKFGFNVNKVKPGYYQNEDALMMEANLLKAGLGSNVRRNR